MSSDKERPAGRPEEESTPIAKLRELSAGAGGQPRAAAREQSLDALERAADGIRPSWHGTEIEGRSPESEPADAVRISVAFPPPPALPTFESFSFDQRAPQTSADSTMRTAALLPERLAHLLKQPQIAHVSHWLSARPWVGLGVGVGAALLLLTLLWPSAKPAPDAPPNVPADANASAQRPPPLPAPPTNASAVPSAPTGSSGARAGAAGKTSDRAEPPPLPSAKRRDKRAARAGAKPIAGKARERRKTNKALAPAR